MKKLSTLFSFLFSFSILTAQIAPPEAINYSGVARDGSGVELVSTTIGLQLSILETTATGNTVYQEDHITTTDDFGRFSVALGTGAVQTGSFPTIDWGGDSHFLQVGLDEIGGNSYTTMGTTQMLSVPYALYAKSAGESIEDNDTSSTNEIQTLSFSGDTLFLSQGGYVVLTGMGQNSNLPAIITNPATDVTTYTAILGGEVTNLNGTVVVERGVVYDTIPSPTTVVNFSQITIGAGLGSFSDTVGITWYINLGLLINTTYFARAYAITEENNIVYGNQVSFTTGPSTTVAGSGVTDLDGNTYATVIFGNGQEWMTENLRTTVFSNGTPIPNITSDIDWENATASAWCWFENDNSYSIPYGNIYNGYAANDPANVCPSGWHVPDSVEWTEMINYWGGKNQAAKNLASTDPTYWGGSAPTGSSGLNLIASRERDYDGGFGFVSIRCFLWAFGVNYPEFFMQAPLGNVNSNFFPGLGYPIRCVKD